MERITRRMFLRGSATAGAAGAILPAIALSPAGTKDDDGPLLADDVTGTTAYADWHERKYGARPV